MVVTNLEATRLTNDLRAHWANAEMTAQESESWVRVLTDLRFDIAVAAAERLIKSSTFLPKIADFLVTYRSLVPSVAGAERGRWGCRDCDHGWVEQSDGRVRVCEPCRSGEPRQMRTGREVAPPLSGQEVRARVADLRRAIGRLAGAKLSDARIGEVMDAAARMWPGQAVSDATVRQWRLGLRSVDASLIEEALGAAFDASPDVFPAFAVVGAAYTRLVGFRAGGVLATEDRSMF